MHTQAEWTMYIVRLSKQVRIKILYLEKLVFIEIMVTVRNWIQNISMVLVNYNNMI